MTCPKCDSEEWDTSAFVAAVCSACDESTHIGDPGYYSGADMEIKATCLCGQKMNSYTLEGIKSYNAMATCGDCGHYD